jgi:hypothetical protein
MWPLMRGILIVNRELMAIVNTIKAISRASSLSTGTCLAE